MTSSVPSPEAPAPDAGPAAHWARALAAGQFLIQRCGTCGRSVFHPRLLCPHCSSRALEWFVPSSRGTVHAVTVVARSGDRGGDYNVVLVDLPEGVRLMGRVDGLSAERLYIGLEVQAAVEDGIVVWRPAD